MEQGTGNPTRSASRSGCAKTKGIDFWENNGGTIAIKAVGPVTVICGGLTVSKGVDIVLDTSALGAEGGVFLFQDGSPLYVNGGSLTANGYVTIAFANNSVPQFTGGAVNLTAPPSGPYQGLAIMASKDNTKFPFILNGGSQQIITGAICLPGSAIQCPGNSSSTGTGSCTQIVASQVTFIGTTQIGSNCEGIGVRSFGSGGVTPTALLE